MTTCMFYRSHGTPDGTNGSNVDVHHGMTDNVATSETVQHDPMQEAADNS
jgi:hypothetical protein